MFDVVDGTGELVTRAPHRELAENLCGRIWRAVEVRDEDGATVAMKRDGVVVRVGAEVTVDVLAGAA